MKRLNILKNKKGNISIVMVIAVVIATIVVTGLVDILNRTYTLKEVESIMDMCGVSTLESVVQDKQLKEEIFSYNDENEADINTQTKKTDNNTSIVSAKYKQLMNSAIKTNSNLKKVNITNTNVEFIYGKGKTANDGVFGLGKSKKARPQIVLFTTAEIYIKTSNSSFNIPEVVEKEFFNSRSNSKFKIRYKDKTADGYTVLTVRSETRVVYR